jgi:hypothetical protein
MQSVQMKLKGILKDVSLAACNLTRFVEAAAMPRAWLLILLLSCVSSVIHFETYS